MKMKMNYVITLLFSLSLMFSEKDCSPKNNISTISKVVKNDEMDLGVFSISLNVKDIKASYEFYQKMGFEHLEGAGAIEQNWMILKNGNSKIGLFQGMFPKNTLTFSPTDARPIYKKLKAGGAVFSMANGMDKEEGVCSFVMVDPDGNPVLVDQH